MRNVSFVFVFLLSLLAYRLAGQEVVVQPTLADQGLRGMVRKVSAIQRFASGNDLNMEESWEYSQSGALEKYVKKGFGGEKTTLYPQHKQADPNRETEYDWDGDPVVERTFSSSHQLLSSSYYIYGKTGSLSVVIRYDYDPESRGEVCRRQLRQYNDKGQLVAVEQYDAFENLLMEERYAYDKKGNLTSRVQTFYDDNDFHRTEEHRKYVYDKAGNWTECRLLNNGTLVSTTSRTLVYY